MYTNGKNFEAAPDYQERKLRRQYEKQRISMIRRFVLILLAAVVLTAVITANVVSRKALVEVENVVLRVEENDSLWGMVKDYCPETMDIRDYIDIVEGYNNCSSNLSVGQIIVVPIFEEVNY